MAACFQAHSTAMSEHRVEIGESKQNIKSSIKIAHKNSLKLVNSLRALMNKNHMEGNIKWTFYFAIFFLVPILRQKPKRHELVILTGWLVP